MSLRPPNATKGKHGDRFGKHRSQNLYSKFPTVNLSASIPLPCSCHKRKCGSTAARTGTSTTDFRKSRKQKDPNKVLIDMDYVEPRCTRHTLGGGGRKRVLRLMMMMMMMRLDSQRLQIRFQAMFRFSWGVIDWLVDGHSLERLRVE